MVIGMIYVYTDKKDSENWILQNDWYFNLYTSNEEFTEEDRKLIEKIDHATLTKDKRIETRYGLGTIRNLSSGCKTMFNIKKHSDMVVSVEECGKNVLDELFTWNGIRIFMSRPNRINIPDDVEICFNNKDIVLGRGGFETWWTEEYKRRELDDL